MTGAELDTLHLKHRVAASREVGPRVDRMALTSQHDCVPTPRQAVA
jgi:hypothetical protein